MKFLGCVSGGTVLILKFSHYLSGISLAPLGLTLLVWMVCHFCLLSLG